MRKNRRNNVRKMRKHQGKRWETVRKPGKRNIEGITMIITGTQVPKTKRQNVSRINVSIISVDRVFHRSANFCQLFMVIIFIHNLQNRKSRKVIVRYLAEINVFDDFSQTVHVDDNTPKMQLETVLKKVYRKQKKPHYASYVQFVIFNPWKVPWS